jgi:hypothetical protein
VYVVPSWSFKVGPGEVISVAVLPKPKIVDPAAPVVKGPSYMTKDVPELVADGRGLLVAAGVAVAAGADVAGG